MKLNTTKELIEDIKAGKMVILMDDEDRENEGDLVIAAHCITPEIVNFMTLHARGLICLTLMPEKCKQLGLNLMVDKNTAQLETNFTVSIDAAHGITTGISAYDRYKTIADAASVNAQSSDLVVPGHIFPLMAKPGGVLSRAGHTEAGCDIAFLAGLDASSVIVEIMNEDGSMARRDDLKKFADKHGIKIGTIADLIEYRMQTECTIHIEDKFEYPTQWGNFHVTKFHDNINQSQHLAFQMGELKEQEETLVRVQFSNFLRELRGVDAADDYWTAQRAMQKIAKIGKGVLVILNSNETAPVQIDEIAPNHQTKKEHYAYHNVGVGSQILKALNVGKMKLMSPETRYPALSGFGLEITKFIKYTK
ncbi:MAG: 3,4-dihydroxy-2-butanone-4-phosphate synthase [Marinicellaceae bacterium]